MIYISTSMPKNWRYILFNRKVFSIFGVPDELNYSSCTVKNHSRTRWGYYCKVDLVRLATFQIPACLSFILLLLICRQNMKNLSKPQMLAHIEQQNTLIAHLQAEIAHQRKLNEVLVGKVTSAKSKVIALPVLTFSKKGVICG